MNAYIDAFETDEKVMMHEFKKKSKAIVNKIFFKVKLFIL